MSLVKGFNVSALHFSASSAVSASHFSMHPRNFKFPISDFQLGQLAFGNQQLALSLRTHE
jgi:hypothetical protein